LALWVLELHTISLREGSHVTFPQKPTLLRFPGGRGYDIFSGAAVAYAEADLGLVRPFVAFVWGSGDGDPTDNKLHGFSPAANQDVTQITGTNWFAHLDTSANFAGRDYACPARLQGMRTAPTAATGPLAKGISLLHPKTLPQALST